MNRNTIERIKQNLDRPVILIGIMGCGKSHLGRLLAERLETGFVDSDAVIEAKAGCTITEIFERDGEAKFRDVEARTIAELIGQGPQVISTGGGAPCNPQTLALIREKSIAVWIQADMEDIWARVQKNENRPLLTRSDNPRQVLQTRLNERRPFYEQAHIHVHNAEGHINEALEEILHGLDKSLNPA